MGVFDRYAPFVQDFIYRHDWESLRGVQVAAAEALFDTEDNVLLTASTASGKTEAAFFPILTLFDENPPTSVGALYIGPLKALINDQFLRLNDLCEEAQIPVWRWHGDVSASHKARMLKHPSGILQITPESLESLLLHRSAAVAHLFGDLRFVVIDEVHSLLRGDRGGQTLCLIERLGRMAQVNPRRIGLSATIGDPNAVGAFLSAGTGRGWVVPEISEPHRTWHLSMQHFYKTGPQAADTVGSRALQAPLAASAAPREADPGLGYIFEHTYNKKCLVFANSREEAEAVCGELRSYCEARHEPDRFLIHHGNLSSPLRESAEDAMRDEESQITTVATATLELGIDIGRLERSFQIDAPFTVSAFLQRMGRTGRRGQPAEMWFVMREEQPEARALLPETLPWKLLQGIAIVQLYLEDRWVEPPRLDRLPYSLLYHQTLATLASEGELTPAELAQRILSLTVFHRVSADDFRLLLRHLLVTDHVEQTETGGLIVGLAGERITNSFKFYAVFQENEEYTVRSSSAELGTIVQPPPPGERIAIAGATWIVEEVDHKRHLVYATQVKGRVPAYFGECAGDVDSHVLERMCLVLEEQRSYPYLMENAAERLALARRSASGAHMNDRPLINLGGDTWCLFPWLGTYAFLALERLLKIKCAKQLGIKGLDASRPYFIQFRMAAGPREFFATVAHEAMADFDPLELVYPGELPRFEKYDAFLPPDLVRKGFAEGVLDIDGMRERVIGWTRLAEGLLLSEETCGIPLEPDVVD